MDLGRFIHDRITGPAFAGLHTFWDWLSANADPLGVIIAALGLLGGIVAFVGRNWIGKLFRGHASRKQLEKHLQQARDRLRARTLPALPTLTIGKLFQTAGLLQPFRFSAPGADSEIEHEELIDRIASGRHFQCQLVLSEAGSGKSTLAMYVFDTLAQNFLKGSSQFAPVYIDLRTYAFDTEFGSKNWLDQFLNQLGLSIADLNNYRLVLDGLDELLSSRPANERHRTFDWILSIAAFVSCRTSFFDRYLAANSTLAGAQRLDMIPWKQTNVLDYTRSLLALVAPHRSAELANLIEHRLRSNAAIAAICSTPLRVNLYVGVLLENDAASQTIDDHASLYQLYTTETLRREQTKSGSLLTPEQALDSLTAVAWAFYSEDTGHREAIPFTQTEFVKFLRTSLPTPLRASADSCASEMVERSLLETRQTYGVAIEREIIRFAHKSIQDFLVARFLSLWCTQSEDIAELPFRRPLNPEVSEFLKELLGYISHDPRLSKVAVEKLGSAYESASRHVHGNDDRDRLALQQLAYYLGSIDHPNARGKLRDLATKETDLWIKRGIVIGLAFSGDSDLLNQYIEELRTEREVGGSSLNDVNIGFHLSFFGDQGFDPLHPEIDQGGLDCTKTVERLVYQLTTETDRPNWRLNLYTLIDLYSNRTLSRDACVRALRAKKASLQDLLSQFRADPAVSRWPELGEIDAIVRGL